MTWQEIKDLEVWETRDVVSSPHPPNFSRLGKKFIWYSVGGRNLLSDEILKFSYLFFCWALPAVPWWKLIQPLYNSILSNARFDFSAFPLKVVIIALHVCATFSPLTMLNSVQTTTFLQPLFGGCFFANWIPSGYIHSCLMEQSMAMGILLYFTKEQHLLYNK